MTWQKREKGGGGGGEKMKRTSDIFSPGCIHDVVISQLTAVDENTCIFIVVPHSG